MVSTISLSFPASFRNAPVKLIHSRFPSRPPAVRMPGLAPKGYWTLVSVVAGNEIGERCRLSGELGREVAPATLQGLKCPFETLLRQFDTDDRPHDNAQGS